MARWYRLGLVALILLVVWGCGKGRTMTEVNPVQPRFTKADNGVITDSVTGLDWYVAPNRDNNWHQAKAWTESLTVAGGGWRMPTVAELIGIYQKGASPNNMDPLFQSPGVWVWSGQLNNAVSAWGYAFYSGLVGYHGIDYALGRQVFAVRSRR
ncbi:MAG: DUF1566 domain-containing protein [Proteobacteria bacterium]|nr:DUF1566 domain-containing protein [Pseudomonadota bacterium]MBU4354632.1 DUF1566 domain-containing protein [Pseudomonadota bacterium]MBU4449459.1 DUF1566 domain-containing protein [Pseudomonadota bacterium]MCG2774018.1 DUF1566 domain-containing protein [Desulfobacterales bacterium]